MMKKAKENSEDLMIIMAIYILLLAGIIVLNFN